MNYPQLKNQAEDFVKNFMHEHDNPDLRYHNFAISQSIAAIAGQIAAQYKLDEKDNFIVNTAAWFLYSGYYKDILKPQQSGAELAEEFCKNSGVEEETIQSIKNCILAPKNTRPPATLLEEIICDADSSYLGAENFSDYNRLRRKEFELMNNIDIDKRDWTKSTIKLFEEHQYFTAYSKQHLDKTKMENLEKLKRKLLLVTSSVNPITALLNGQTDAPEKSDNKKNNKKNSPERTIETMFRTTSGNSQRLSSQADTKAHIMISVNSIIISILLTIVVRKMDEYSRFTIPVIMLMIVNLTTIIFSILATRPNIPKGIFNETELKNNKVNLFFFGNFFKMNFDDYSKSMLQIMGDRQFLYLTMLRNLHEQGVVLGKKYRMLKTAYNIFMYGLIISVIVFFIASRFFPGKTS